MPVIYGNQINPLVEQLVNSTQIKQRTEQWFLSRRSAITASEISNALTQSINTCKSYIELINPSFNIKPGGTCGYSSTKFAKSTTRIKKFITDKAFPDNISNISNKFTLWGERFEPIASGIYAQMNHTDVYDLGLIPHPKYEFLAASPDGITSNARLIEIKCPRNRDVEGPIPLYYYHQMLLQLECTGCEECDFVDCEFIEYIDSDEWMTDGSKYAETHTDEKFITFGLLLEYKSDRIYPPWNLYKISDIFEWYDKNKDEDYKPVFYKLEKMRIQNIKRDPQWLIDNISDLQNVWNRILQTRTEETTTTHYYKKQRISRRTTTTPFTKTCLL